MTQHQGRSMQKQTWGLHLQQSLVAQDRQSTCPDLHMSIIEEQILTVNSHLRHKEGERLSQNPRPRTCVRPRTVVIIQYENCTAICYDEQDQVSFRPCGQFDIMDPSSSSLRDSEVEFDKFLRNLM
jgi:hypothetical protein